MYICLRNTCPECVFLNLCHALVSSRLSYGLCYWGGTHISSLQAIVILQERFIRLIAQKSRLTRSWPLFTKLKYLLLRHLYVYRVLRAF